MNLGRSETIIMHKRWQHHIPLHYVIECTVYGHTLSDKLFVHRQLQSL